MKASPLRTIALIVSSFLALSAVPLQAQSNNLVIYDDNLENGFQNWGWATLNYNNTSPVHSGSDSVSILMTSGYQGIQIVNPSGISTSPYANITFWMNG